jgi:hypothetical protein
VENLPLFIMQAIRPQQKQSTAFSCDMMSECFFPLFFSWPSLLLSLVLLDIERTSIVAMLCDTTLGVLRWLRELFVCPPFLVSTLVVVF